MAENKIPDHKTVAEQIDALMQEDEAARKKQLYRRKLPADTTLAAALDAMTKSELDDIRYNLNVTGASSLKKAELIDALVPAILAFSERWFPTVIDEEYAVFAHLMEKGGRSSELRDDDLRLDYLRGLGLVACGTDADGTLVWLLPDEIQAKWKTIDSGTYKSLVDLNTEVTRLTAGLLFYYGYLNFDQLYAMVTEYLEPAQREQVSFLDLVGILLNASCWKKTLVALPHGVKYYTLIDEEALQNEQLRRSNLDFAPLTYSQVYDAGDDNYIDATPAYQALAQFIMNSYGYDVLKAADVVGEVYILLQNGQPMDKASDYLDELGFFNEDAKARELLPLLIAFNNTSHLWPLKGNTPERLMNHETAARGNIISFAEAQKKRAKVGRNDPCPCGSGKKYKNCCLKKDEE